MYLNSPLTVSISATGKSTPMNKLTLMHHILGSQCMYSSLFPMNFMVLFGSAMLWLEFSTFFIAFRWMMFFHGIMGGDWKQTLNSVFTAFSFLFLRTVFCIYGVFAIGGPWMYKTFQESGHSYGFHALNVEFTIVAFINVGLNLHWSWLIVK